MDEGCLYPVPFESRKSLSGYWCREQPGQLEDGSITSADGAEEEKKEPDRVLRCSLCGAGITHRKERCSRSGKHLHTFFNPAGIVYEIGCFQQAPGCLLYGPPSIEFPWFAGYSWRVVYCNACLEHLGWHFSTGQDAFFGLIVDRLREG